MNKVYCLIGLLVAGTSPLLAKDYLVICSGQSNMAGVAPVAQMPEELKAVPENIVYFKNSDLTKPLEPLTTFADGPKYGPTPSFARALAEARPKDRFIILLNAVGGSALLEWMPDYGPPELTSRVTKSGATVKMPVGRNYAFVPKQIELLRQKFPDAEPLAFVWIQGESDAAPWAAAYLENFKRLIANMRTLTTAPNLFVVTADPGTADAAVYEAFNQYAKDDINSVHVSTRDLNPGNGLHYSPTAYVEIGKRLAAAVTAHLPAGP
jgi:lysophospholipase L1-like esterase